MQRQKRKGTSAKRILLERERERMSGGGMESVAGHLPEVGRRVDGQLPKERCGYFQMPLHYPRYTKSDYENMPEWKLDCLLTEYGLPVSGDVSEKRKFAMGSFLWNPL